MQYTVISPFADLQDNNHVYNAGDKYPRQGLTVTEGRIAELSSGANRLRTPLIKAEIVKRKATAKRDK